MGVRTKDDVSDLSVFFCFAKKKKNAHEHTHTKRASGFPLNPDSDAQTALVCHILVELS